ncbi:hypothetical protein NFI96_024428 [Prochilodus magdalenae]|nr:hypothetical protein NFI96_024428 [Prochilodus magdalenae]
MNSVFRSTARAARAVTALPGINRTTAQWSRFMCSGTGGQKNLAEMVKKDKVVVFMKGTPAQPMCGFSNAVVQILRMHGVDNYAAYNVLDDQDLRQVRFYTRGANGALWGAAQAPGPGQRAPVLLKHLTRAAQTSASRLTACEGAVSTRIWESSSAPALLRVPDTPLRDTELTVVRASRAGVSGPLWGLGSCVKGKECK